MLYFRSCPRCITGTVELASDSYGAYLDCLNCGFHKAGTAFMKFVAGRTGMVTSSARPGSPSHPVKAA